MSAFRFVSGIGAGVAILALVAGATGGAPTAAEPETAPPPPRVETRPAAAATGTAATSAAMKASVQRGVLARAAASRRAKHGAKDPKAAQDAVIESVEVDWGASQPRP